MENDFLTSRPQKVIMTSNVIKIITSVLDYFIVFLMAIMTGCGWAYDANLDLSASDLFTYMRDLLIITSIIYFVSYRTFFLPGCRKQRLFFAFLVILTYSFYNKTNSEVFASRHIFIFSWLVLWTVLHEDKKKIWKKFVDVVVVLAILSLFFYLFGSVLGVIPEYNAAKRIWGGWKPDIIRNFYYCYYESHYMRIGSHILWRNVGCFTEGPMYNFVLCAALGAEVFIVGNKSNKKRYVARVIILTITILSTLSTTGFMFLALVGAISFIRKADKNRFAATLKKHFKLFLSIVLIMLVGLVLAKLVSSNGRGSFGVRSDHLFACIEAFLRKPIMGCGWNNTGYIYNFMTYKQGLSVGLPSFMAYGGILLSSVIFVPILLDIQELRSADTERVNLVSFEILFLLLFFFTSVNSYPILWFFIGYIMVNECGTAKKSMS